ncbi:hypothetical protein [Microbacterium neimengense]
MSCPPASPHPVAHPPSLGAKTPERGHRIRPTRPGLTKIADATHEATLRGIHLSPEDAVVGLRASAERQSGEAEHGDRDRTTDHV